MPGVLPSIGEGLIVGLFERWSYLKPDVSTHIYFRAEDELSIHQLAAKFGLEAGTIFSPDSNALYTECGEPGELYIPVMFIPDEVDGTAFAILMRDVRMLKLALEFAKPFWPFGGDTS